MSESICSTQSPLDVIIEHIFETRRITRADQKVFMTALLSKHNLTPSEQTQIDRVFAALRQGRLKVVE